MHQISILEWFLKGHVTLKTGVMTDKDYHHRNKIHQNIFKQKAVIWNCSNCLTKPDRFIILKCYFHYKFQYQVWQRRSKLVNRSTEVNLMADFIIETLYKCKQKKNPSSCILTACTEGHHYTLSYSEIKDCLHCEIK